MFRSRIAGVLALMLLCALVVVAPAQAAFPGTNGKIAYWINACQIKTINPDGSGAGTLSVCASNSGDPMEDSLAWSPDGTKLAFIDGQGDVGTINADSSGNLGLATVDNGKGVTWSADGTKVIWGEWTYENGCSCERHFVNRINADGSGGFTTLANGDGSDPSSRPDGGRIAFLHFSGDVMDHVAPLWTMDSNGESKTPIGSLAGRYPDWSPDGFRIVYGRETAFQTSHIYVANADGSGETQLTNAGAGVLDEAPTWSPDGTKIAFSRIQCPSSCGPAHIITMNSDGSGQTDVTPSETAAHFGSYPSWQPVPYTGYARPRGATPTQIALVPAYVQCTSPNRSHGAPLSNGSCGPPSQTSSQLTTGTPDANGQPVKMYTKIVYATLRGDLAVKTTITDVRNKSDLSDYTGELSLSPGLRITDKNNTPNPGGPGPGTVTDTTLPITIPCATTTDTTIGSSCNLSTTVNSVYPGAVVAGKRAIWQLGQVRVYDGGADGLASTTADNTLFLDQGVFVP